VGPAGNISQTSCYQFCCPVRSSTTY